MFLDEITKNLGISGTDKNNFSILNYGAKGVYIQGKINITLCTDTKIDIFLGSAYYSILGEKLTIKRLAKDNLYITGQIGDITKIS